MEVEAFCQEIAATLYRAPIQVEIKPAEAAMVEAGQPVTVAITSSLDRKTLFVGRVFRIDQVKASSTMLKDG